MSGRSQGFATIRIALPYHLRNLAGVGRELSLEVASGPEGDVPLAALLSALEEQFPVLRGTIRDPASGRRRAFVRFFACRRDLSHEPPGAPLPREVVEGREVLTILGAMAGG